MADDVLADLQHCMGLAGMIPAERIVADGQIHRFATAGKRNDDAGWYVVHACAHRGEARYYGAFGDWRTGFVGAWASHEAASYAERERLRLQIEAARRRRVQERLQRDEHGAERAQRLWASAGPCDATHPYLTAKGLPADHRIRAYGDDLLVPMQDADGRLWNLQRIAANGAKKYGHGRAARLMMPLGDMEVAVGRIGIGEGYATCRSMELADRWGLVVVAFSAGQLGPVAREMRRRYPLADIDVMADNDTATAGNPGVREARAAAASVRGRALVPQDGGEPVDFNDLWRAYGWLSLTYLEAAA